MRAIIEDRNSAQKHVWRARIILASADGLLFSRTKTRPPGRKPLAPARVAAIVRLTQAPPAGKATRWTLRAMAKTAGVETAEKVGSVIAEAMKLLIARALARPRERHRYGRRVCNGVRTSPSVG